jgi:sporulation protein YlmC with PRC-barrel domain
MRLVYDGEGGDVVKVGDHVLINETSHIITHIIKPHKPASTGRVVVRNELTKQDYSYFPSVIDAHWIEREDHA